MKSENSKPGAGRAAMDLPPIEALEGLINVGRSVKYGYRRHAILRGGREDFSGPPRGAAEHARLWEARLGRGKKAGFSFAGIDRAVALEPREALWRAWRAVGRLAAG